MSARGKSSNFGVAINRASKGDLQNSLLFSIMRCLLRDVAIDISGWCTSNDISRERLCLGSVKAEKTGDVIMDRCRRVLKYASALLVYEKYHARKMRQVPVPDYASAVVSVFYTVLEYMSCERTCEDPVVTSELVDKWGGTLRRGYPSLIRKILNLYEDVYRGQNSYLCCITIKSEE